MDMSLFKKVEMYSRSALAVTAAPLLYWAYVEKSFSGGVIGFLISLAVYFLVYYLACNALVPGIQEYVGETSYVPDGSEHRAVTPVKSTDDPELNEYINSYRGAKEAVGKLIGLIAFVFVIAVVAGFFNLVSRLT